MAGEKEIKNRIRSVEDTLKITNAMYAISSSKLKKAKRKLDETRPYFDELQTGIKKLFRLHTELESIYMYPKEEGSKKLSEGTYACLVITADKGMAGAYNKNVLKEAERLRAEHPDLDLYVVGEIGRHYFEHRKIPIEKSFLYTAQNPTFRRARDIAGILMDGYLQRRYTKIHVIYTDLKKASLEEVNNVRILPFHRAEFYEEEGGELNGAESKFEYFPSIEEVLDNAVFGYVSGFIYSALIDSFCSEQNARMEAMDASTSNATELLSKLRLEYNRKRQAAITQEITEVSAGAKAQKKRRKVES